jgi:aspartokinase/homoserine dehydrogenase 1
MFGGACLDGAEGFRRAAEIVAATAQPDARQAIVISASANAAKAPADPATAVGADPLTDLRREYEKIAQAILSPTGATDLLASLRADAATVDAEEESRQVGGSGDIWASRLFAQVLRERPLVSDAVSWLDARKILVVDWTPLGPAVDWQASEARLQAVIPTDFAGILVMPGAVASDRGGGATTLGRDGADYSASVLGALLKASIINIWTDSDGVYSADPRRVPEATPIGQLSYNEAMELAYFGAGVLHPQAMAPAAQRGIPIRIRNAFAPEREGTLICEHPATAHPVKGITSIDEVALINLEGAGMIGVPGTAHRLFGALGDAGASVIMISQGSSEHSICCAVPDEQADHAAAVVRRAFARELREGQIQSVGSERSLAILAIVGDGMAGIPGVAAKFFGALGAAGVNVRAIAQGASERNISVVIDGRNTARALRAAHAGFYLSPHTLSIGVIGPGAVGGVLLDQMCSQSARLLEQFGVHLRVRAIAGSKRMALSETGFDLGRWGRDFEAHASATDLDRFADHIGAGHLPHAIIIDCSASEAVARRYRDWLERGIHIVTPNKKANSGDYAYYAALTHARRVSGAHYLYEATVGAGLPIIQTARNLRETGDEILSIDGMFSGTLAYLFNTYDGAIPFSNVMVEAKRLGYTEPDPRDDLSGLDVARKLIILGREMGLSIELRDIQIESLVPHDLSALSIEEFMVQLPRYDEAIYARFEAARLRGRLLRHVGRVNVDGTASVGLVELASGHPFANVALTDNIFRFRTRRYSANPLIVQGPGAGPDVTAGGVFGDLLRLASKLGARF